MIKYFYVRTQDNRCPFAHRYDCLERDDLLYHPESTELFPIDRYDPRYLVTYIDGVDAPQATLSSSEMANGDGSKFIKSNIPSRTVTIKFLFNPYEDGADTVNARVDLERVFGVGNFVQLYLVDSCRPWDVDSYNILDYTTSVHFPTTNLQMYTPDGTPCVYKFRSNGLDVYYRWNGYEWTQLPNLENVNMYNGWTLSGHVETHESDMYGSQCWAQVTIKCDDPKIYYWNYKQFSMQNISNALEGFQYSTAQHSIYNRNAPDGIYVIKNNAIMAARNEFNSDAVLVPTGTYNIDSGYIKDGNVYYDATYIQRSSTSDVVSYTFRWNAVKTMDLYNVKTNSTVSNCTVRYFDIYKSAGTTVCNWSSFSPSVVKVPLLHKSYDTSRPCPDTVTSTVPETASYVDVTEAIWDTYGVRFHDSCNVPLSIRFVRGVDFPATDQANYIPAVQYMYYGVDENYVANNYTVGKYFLNIKPGRGNGFDNPDDRLTIFCESFPDEYEASAVKEESTVANPEYISARIKNRDAYSFYKKFGRTYFKQLLAFVPLSEDTWPMMQKGTADGFRVKLAYSKSSSHSSDVNFFKEAAVYFRPYRLAL